MFGTPYKHKKLARQRGNGIADSLPSGSGNLKTTSGSSGCPLRIRYNRSSRIQDPVAISRFAFLPLPTVNDVFTSASPTVQSYDIVRNVTTLEPVMEKPVSAADANRKFSKLLRTIREGHSYVVTSHGKAVAKILPIDKNPVTPGARSALLKRLRSEPVVTIGRWSRGELYEDER